MRPRTAALLLLSVAGLFLIGAGLGLRLVRAGLRAADLGTEQRLRAIGLTASRALSAGLSLPLLDRIARENDLEAAYLLDESLKPIERDGKKGLSISLLRIDPDRALRALRGEVSIGPAYRLDLGGSDDANHEQVGESTALESATVLAGYFPVSLNNDGAQKLLVLEAGTVFAALPAELRNTAWAAFAAAFGMAALCVLLILAALRAAAREQRLQAAAERGQALRELAAMVAHEIRNPLGTIRAGAELLNEMPASPQILEDILGEVDRLADLTTQFLQFSRDPPLTVAELNLATLCDELCTRLRRKYPDEATLRIVREGDRELLLQGDADRLRQVLLNLALNAVQAMESVDGPGTLTLSLHKLDGGGAEVRVRDTGSGLSSEARASLFTPFHTTKASGTGLGLAISRRIVEKHGGSLSIGEEISGGERNKAGACFVLRLPQCPPANAN